MANVDGLDCSMDPKLSEDKGKKKKVGPGLVKSLHCVWRVKSCTRAISEISGSIPSPYTEVPIIV